MSNQVSINIIKLRNIDVINFEGIDETTVPEYIEYIMEKLLSGEKSVLCKNLNLSGKGILSKISESVHSCYNKKHPISLFYPEIEFYDPAGDDVYYYVSLHKKLKSL